MSDPQSVEALVSRAGDGDEAAWRMIVDRFAPLVLAVARIHGLSQADQEEVACTVWLRLVENLARLRDPRALPGWIKSTSRNEALRLCKLRNRSVVMNPDDGEIWNPPDSADLDEELLRVELHHALREAMRTLTPRDRELVLLFLEDPPVSYQQITERTGIPHGSIGPTRNRCLQKLRSSNALRDFHDRDRDPGKEH